jgi:hypothetical protein
MKDSSYVDLTIKDVSQIKFELGRGKTEHVLTSNLGKFLTVTYEEGILQLTFEQAELRLEIEIDLVFRLCQQIQEKSVKTVL